MNDQLAMDGVAAFVHILSIHSIVSVQLWQFLVVKEIALQFAINRRRCAAQPVCDLRHRHFGFKPLGNLPAFFQTQVRVAASHSIASMQTSVLIQNLHFGCESTRVHALVATIQKCYRLRKAETSPRGVTGARLCSPQTPNIGGL
ncbi:hypothetical protein METH_22820 (plasmid) [Leisingera methylohalidivorans DSM 14336]|uniref:Uncharacterized protein n=1 Tax=Leisingera methylohalidivorans DSM 14336 TaxID=999552 RepID=V9VY58_9RHOB|nr:hypothetical protein METH_22820 [Leisingera methylohalidivorans DSM 14336]